MSVQTIISKFSKNTKALNSVNYTSIDSPVGKAIAVADDNFLYLFTFEDSKNLASMLEVVHKKLSCQFIEEKNKILHQFEEELSDYFEGKLKNFTVPINPIGSDFQKAVWDHLLEVPYGFTQTYADLAKAMGRSASHSRAVGAACGANPVIIVVPCHRLISSAPKGGGYSCGVDRKSKLIEHENKHSCS